MGTYGQEVSTGTNSNKRRVHIPVSVGGNDIVDLEFLSNLLDAQMESVGLELFAGHVGNDGGGEAHQAGSLVLGRFAPAVALLAAPRSVMLGS